MVAQTKLDAPVNYTHPSTFYPSGFRQAPARPESLRKITKLALRYTKA